MPQKLQLLPILFLLTQPASANNPDTSYDVLIDQALEEVMFQAYIDSLERAFQYQTGLVSIGNGLATIAVPPGFKYLDGPTSEFIFTKLYGNPPSEPGYESLGMLLPEGRSPLDDSCYVIDIHFYDEGYIDDSDAKGLDFDELFITMQEDIRMANPERIENGYLPIELVAWASPPYYDDQNKKLHWAKELKFGDSEENTLNYNIQILGRRGYLELNVVGEIYLLEQIKSEIDPVLASVNFEKGHTYREFNPNLDEVAGYGIGGLIAGKLLLKAGLFAKLGLFLAKFWKVLLIALAGAGTFIRRIVRGNRRDRGAGIEER
ncbi:MAG: DUF2167 domain-containing protein [Saprospiraceae bacterium]